MGKLRVLRSKIGPIEERKRLTIEDFREDWVVVWMLRQNWERRPIVLKNVVPLSVRADVAGNNSNSNIHDKKQEEDQTGAPKKKFISLAFPSYLQGEVPTSNQKITVHTEKKKRKK